jgi:hypothetical protein
VLAWVAYAREVLALVERLAHELPVQVPPDVVVAFGRYVDEWEKAAKTDTFEWEGELEALQVRHLMTYWLNLAKILSDRVHLQGPTMPEAAEPFYEMVIDVILRGLAEEDRAAERLQKAWPFRP